MTDKLVRVLWRDTACLNGWRTVSEVQRERSVVVESVGWLKPRQGKDVVLVPNRVRELGTVSEVHLIPRENILRIDRLRKKKKR